jgi:TolA-binding protein
VLRQFTDSNNDNIVDTWSYYRGGLEVYRDADLNFNGKADQYRWFHTGGSRWGIDKDEDGRIDAWKMISAEEAAEEAVSALKTRDPRRFERLLLTKEDVAKLGLAADVAEKLGQRLAQAPKNFSKLASEGKIGANAEYSDFGGLRPGAVPAGTRGGTKDLIVYENVWVMAVAGDKPTQLQLGSMVYLDGCWKLIDGPAIGGSDAVAAGFFYDSNGAPLERPQIAATEPTDEMQKILEEIQQVDEQMIKAADGQKAALSAKRADLLEKLAYAAKEPAERDQWLKQLADMLSANVQDGSYPEGIERLKKMETKLAAEKASEDVLTHVEFARMQAAWGLAQSQHKPEEYAKIQEEWLKQLEDFVGKHKSSEDVAEALLQLGMASEFSGNIEDAQKWYGRLAKDFPKSPRAAKAQGAVRRLTSQGKTIPLKGQDINGGAVDLGQYKGKVVLIHYWSASLPSAKDDHEKISDLYKKYGGAKFDVIGVNLDYSKDDVVAYLKANPNLRWKNIYEPGAFDSRLATEMGVITVPMLVLVDDKGQVVSTTLQIPEVEGELAKLLAARVANAKN